MENPPDHTADPAMALQERLKIKWLFQCPDEADEKPNQQPAVKEELPEDPQPVDGVQLLLKPVAPVVIHSDDEHPAAAPSSWHNTITSGEPQAAPDGFAPESYDTDHHWDPEGRPPWQRHSELGPNLHAAGRHTVTEAMQNLVNPVDFDWHAAGNDTDLGTLRTTWEEMLNATTAHSDEDKAAEKLNDDLQLLFVSLILEHAEEVFHCWEKGKQPTPLRLFLLGTAGTGKTTATQTALQELQQKLTAAGLTHDFFRVAAPTGSAAFNIRFNATTVHRLIRWFNLRFFEDLKDPEK